jgi:hypothetical protein
MRFQLNDQVQKIGDWKTVYVIVGLRPDEPCFETEVEGNPESRHWVITEDLELLSAKPLRGRTGINLRSLRTRRN